MRYALILSLAALAGVGALVVGRAVYGQQGGTQIELVGGSHNGTAIPTGVCIPDNAPMHFVPCGKLEGCGPGINPCSAEVQAEVRRQAAERAFDTPPQQWATYHWHDDTCIKMIEGTGACLIISGLEETKHWGCADPRRTLLTSEDGVKHCFLFTGDAFH